MRFVLLQTLLLTTCLSAPAVASEISDLLKKMTDAEGQLNYQGILVLRKVNDLVAMHVEHGTDERGVWESMVSLNGEARRIVRWNDEVTSIFPERQLMTITQSKNKSRLHPALPSNLEKLEAFYTINRLKDDRIADRSVAVLDVVPNDGFRYGYRYWLDQKTGVLLRCDMMNEKRHVLEQMMFTKVEYLPTTPESAFTTIKPDGFKQKRLGQAQPEQQNPTWQANDLPAGFMLTQSRTRPTKDGEILHLAYSDGLASVSVFVESEQGAYRKREGASMMGAMNAYRAHVGQHFVTVIGEVPSMTVKQIAQSVVPIKTETAK